MSKFNIEKYDHLAKSKVQIQCNPEQNFKLIIHRN